MRKFEKLRIKVKQLLDLELHNFKRTRIGYSGKESGAFTWIADCNQQCGSTFTVTELLKSDRLDLKSDGYNLEIIPSTK